MEEYYFDNMVCSVSQLATNDTNIQFLWDGNSDYKRMMQFLNNKK